VYAINSLYALMAALKLSFLMVSETDCGEQSKETARTGCDVGMLRASSNGMCACDLATNEETYLPNFSQLRAKAFQLKMDILTLGKDGSETRWGNQRGEVEGNPSADAHVSMEPTAMPKTRHWSLYAFL
jgi:hypothetical protein